MNNPGADALDSIIIDQALGFHISDERMWAAFIEMWNRIAGDHAAGFIVHAAGEGPWRNPDAYDGVIVTAKLAAECKAFLAGSRID